MRKPWAIGRQFVHDQVSFRGFACRSKIKRISPTQLTALRLTVVDSEEEDADQAQQRPLRTVRMTVEARAVPPKE